MIHVTNQEGTGGYLLHSSFVETLKDQGEWPLKNGRGVEFREQWEWAEMNPVDADGNSISVGDVKWLVSTVSGSPGLLKKWRVIVKSLEFSDDRECCFVEYECKYELGYFGGTTDPEYFFSTLESASKAGVA